MNRTTVIVGAGSSGCLLANRLSQDPSHRVILLEAGPDYFPGEIPQDLQDGRKNSFRAHDWGYSHRPTRKQLRIPFPRGRVVGGSSAVNTCIALRGQPADFEEWADMGLSEWAWDECLPAFRSIENDLDFDNEYHGKSGPMPVRRHPENEWTPWQSAFVEGCVSLGHSECPDGNEPYSVGVGPHAMNKLEDRRISAAEAFLTGRVRARPNLEIRPDTLTHRVEIHGDVATGVIVEHDGKLETIRADEIVLCAGALNTPGLLLRSGIGPRGELERLGVKPTAISAGVARQLLDHPGVAMFLRPRRSAGTKRENALIQTMCRYASGTNQFTNDIVMQAGSSVPTPWGVVPLVSIMLMVGKPRGVGSIFFPSADPHESPIVDSSLLDNEEDRRVAIEGIERALEVASTPAAQKVATPFYPSARTLNDRSRLERKIFKICDSGYHPCGTAPMGGESDPFAVCDGKGRVRGVDRLRIADASLMPTIPHANIHLSVLMVAERISEWMR